MELKIKISNWSAGLPVVMLNEKTAKELGVHAGDRISIKTISKKPREMVTILDTTEKIVNKRELGVSVEIKKRLSLREGQKIDISLSSNPMSVNYIKKKLLGKVLIEAEIKEIIQDVVNNKLSEPEIAVFISAMYKNGMNFLETVSLIDAILYSGKKLTFKNKLVVDKHCIGGIAGNRTTPIIVTICAAGGLIFPKTSSRAITSAAGTADCIEVLAPVEFSMEQLKKIVKKTNGCLTWGGSLGMVPADSKILKVEKMLKLDPTAQLLASIMSKKLADGGKYILIDIPYGKKAKVNKNKAIYLKKQFEKLGKHFNVIVKVILTKGNEPIGNGIGPALEILDVIKVLNPKEEGPTDLEKKSLYLSGLIFEMTGKAKKGKGINLAKEILDSGKAFKKFKEIISAQKGKFKGIKLSKIFKIIHSKKSGKIKEIDNKLINELARVAGCPLDKFAGVHIQHHVGDKIKKGDELITIYAESKPRLKSALKFYHEKSPIKL
jgi:AMP phosphorylase